MGVRPSLDGRHVVEENVRRDWRAGTSREGRVEVEAEEATAFSKALLLHGANIVAGLVGRSHEIAARMVLKLDWSSKNVLARMHPPIGD